VHRGSRLWLSLVPIVVAIGCGSGDGADATPGDTSRAFVISSFGYGFPTHDVDPCPGGFNFGPLEREMQGGAPFADDCDDPTASRDASFKTVTAAGRFDGFDLDGRASAKTAATGDECPHDDFSGSDGGSGIDFQLWRALGCVRGFQRGEIADLVIDSAVKTGAMTIAIEVQDLDDGRNDDAVRVQVFASLDAPPVGGDGSVLPYGTVSVHPDAAYHSEVGIGELVDGVLTAGPMDVHVRLNIQIVQGDLTLRHAWLRAELLSDGTVRGQIAGYQPAEQIYDIFGRQAGAAGAEALSYTCSGLYEALFSQADGDFDPVTRTCSSLSVASRFAGIPVFVVH
jgi:hypothetical protein